MANSTLTKQEENFCELYVFGHAPYAGNAQKCYELTHGRKDAYTNFEAKKLLNREDVQKYISELEAMCVKEAEENKRFIATNLRKIIEESSTNEYRDRWGTLLSPAPLRAVAVAASKALMELYPIKEAQVNKLNINGNGSEGGGITFNVIVPGQSPQKDKD